MLFIALLLSSFRFIPNQCYKFPEIRKPFPELIEFFELIAFDINTDVFGEFAFEDPSLYSAYCESMIGFVKQHSGIVSLHFNLNDIPLKALGEHVLHTDSLEVME